MYLAQKRIKKTLNYFIRQEVKVDQQKFQSRQVVDLGPDPSQYIIYPGGHAFYIDEIILQRLEDIGIEATQEDLEDIFWPFLRSDVKRALEPYRSRSNTKNRGKMTLSQEEKLRTNTHIFDKRRMHYLKFGRMNQGYVGQMSGKLLRDLEGKSRDEIEQYFWRIEKQILKNHELKTYVYVVFDLQRFFTSPSSKDAPDLIDEDSLDEYFLREICHLNSSDNFWVGELHNQNLHDYLVRYLIMFFDNDFTERNLAGDFFRDFVNQHRTFRGYPQKITVTIQEASTIFEVSSETLKTISKIGLIKLYRRLAQKHHPDRGGEHEKFIRLTEAFHSTMRKRRFKA
jgi:hypothetical protein